MATSGSEFWSRFKPREHLLFTIGIIELADFNSILCLEIHRLPEGKVDVSRQRNANIKLFAKMARKDLNGEGSFQDL